MKSIRIDHPGNSWPNRRWVAAVFFGGLLALALSACSKTPERGESRDGKPKGGIKGTAPKGEPTDKEPADKREAAENWRQAAAKQQSINNLKQIMLAIQLIQDTYKNLPPTAICDKKTGKPLLSWRVAILPYIEQANLYKQINLDEPWDGPNNKKLLKMVIPIFAAPGAKGDEAYKTFYRVFVAAPGSKVQTAWQTIPDAKSPFGAWGGHLLKILDGTSNTIGVVEAGEPVPWMKPDPLVFDEKKPLPKLGGLFKDGFNAGMMDGSTLFVPNRVDEKSVRALITANGGEPFPDLEAKGLKK